MPIVYVAGDQARTGKTALCATLVHKLSADGRSVGLVKPLAGSYVRGSEDLDLAAYRAVLGIDAGPAAPVPENGVDDDFVSQVQAVVNRASLNHDLLLVEGSNRLTPAETSRLVEALDASVVLAIGYDPELRISQISPWRDALGTRLACSIVNGLRTYQGTSARGDLMPSLQSAGMRPVGLIPEDRRLLGVQVDEIAQHLDGEYIVLIENHGVLVEHFMVGNQSLDPGELYFGIHDDKAVVVRGDRPDIQMAALATPTACMIITKDMHPIEYVVYEATEEEVPVILVKTDTLDTMDALDTVHERARFDHPAKLDRFSALLDEHVDLSDLYSNAGIAS